MRDGGDRRDHRSDRDGRIRRAGRADGARTPEARHSDERRAGRHHRPHSEGVCRSGRRGPHQRGRRSARGDHGPLPVREGDRGPARAVRQYQGITRSLSKPDDAGGFRETVEPEAPHGHGVCGWLEDLLRAGHRRECHRDARGQARDAGSDRAAQYPAPGSDQVLSPGGADRRPRDRGLRRGVRGSSCSACMGIRFSSTT